MDAHLSNLLTHSIAWCSCKSITLTGNTTYGFLYQCSHISAYKHQVCESGGELNNLPVEIKSNICSRLQCSKISIFFLDQKILLAQNLSVIHFILHHLQFIHFTKHPSIHIQEDIEVFPGQPNYIFLQHVLDPIFTGVSSQWDKPKLPQLAPFDGEEEQLYCFPSPS